MLLQQNRNFNALLTSVKTFIKCVLSRILLFLLAILCSRRCGCSNTTLLFFYILKNIIIISAAASPQHFYWTVRSSSCFSFSLFSFRISFDVFDKKSEKFSSSLSFVVVTGYHASSINEFLSHDYTWSIEREKKQIEVLSYQDSVEHLKIWKESRRTCDTIKW